MKIFKSFCITMLCAVAFNSSAGMIMYTNLTDYINAGGDAAIAVDFEDGNASFFNYGSSYTENGATFTANGNGVNTTDVGDRLSTLNSSTYNTTGLTGRALNNNFGHESISLDFDTGIQSLAFDIATIFNWGQVNPLEVTFDFGGIDTQTITTQQINQTATPLSFVGFIFDHSFTHIDINDATQGVVFDNIRFGEVAAVPEPSSLLIFVMALMGLGLRRLKHS